jgi:serine protease Do
MKQLYVLACALLLAACVNPYEKFYEPVAGSEDFRNSPYFDRSATGVQIYSSANFEEDLPRLLRKGYVPIGSAGFSGDASYITNENVLAQANKVGAHVVLVSSKYSHTVSGAVPMQVPNTSTTYSSGTATAYGSGGSVTAYGHGTSTTYGSQTVVVPYSNDIYEAGAVFFAKRHFALGLMVEDLSPEARKVRGSNQGVRVTVVVDDTPALRAGFLLDDVILSVNGKAVYSEKDYSDAVTSDTTKPVVFELDRGGKTQRLTVQRAALPAPPPQPATN